MEGALEKRKRKAQEEEDEEDEWNVQEGAGDRGGKQVGHPG